MKYLIGIVLVFVASGLYSQNEFTSSKLYNLYELLPKNCKENINSQDSLTCHTRENQLKIKVLRKNGKIMHLGLNLFREDEMSFFPKCVFNFIERYFLELLITEDINLLLKRSNDQRIVLLLNGQQVGKSIFGSIDNLQFLLNRQLQKKISLDSLNYTFIISDGFHELKLMFPANNNIINGMDKLELDKNLEVNLNNYTDKDKTTVAEKSIIDFEPFHEYFISKGESYYKTITSSTFYRKVNNEYLLLYDKKYLAASLTNMLIAGLSNTKKQIEIKHIQYGKEIRTYSLRLNNFVNYFKQENCKLYVGIENENEDTLLATLVIYNPFLNYINIAYINTTANALFDASQKIDVKMYSNIPSDNIKDLYGIFKNDNSLEQR